MRSRPSDHARREFLKSLAAAATATLALPQPRLLANEAIEHPRATADAPWWEDAGVTPAALERVCDALLGQYEGAVEGYLKRKEAEG